jgi:hypothetical protein
VHFMVTWGGCFHKLHLNFNSKTKKLILAKALAPEHPKDCTQV